MQSAFRAILAHGVALHFNSICVVTGPLENAISQRGIADLLMPARDWHLRSQDHRTHLVAALADLPEVAEQSPSHRLRERQCDRVGPISCVGCHCREPWPSHETAIAHVCKATSNRHGEPSAPAATNLSPTPWAQHEDVPVFADPCGFVSGRP